MAFLQSTIDEILSAQTEKALIQVLERFNSPHSFERPEERNLLNWYKVLNRLDELLDRYISSRNVLKPASTDSTNISNESQKLSSVSDPRHKSALQQQQSTTTPKVSGKDSGSASVSGGSKLKSDSDKLSTSFTPSPALVRHILRVTQRLIRNASHDTRTVYNSIEQLGALLADDHSAIVFQTLEIISMLMQRTHKLRPTRSQINFELSDRLLELAVGWGGRENRLGLLECCSSKNTELLPSEGCRLQFEYTKTSSPGSNPESSGESLQGNEMPGTSNTDASGKKSVLHIPMRNSSANSIPFSPSETSTVVPSDREPVVSTSGTITTIVIADVRAFPGTERWLLSEFADKHRIPKDRLFSLLMAFRRATSFSAGRSSRIELAVIRLYAVTILFQLQPLPSTLHDLLGKEPELLRDIVALANGESKDGLDDLPRCLRNIAIRCLTAMSCDRHRFTSIMTATGVNVHHGALPTLLRTEISSLLSSATGESPQPDEQPDVAAMDLSTSNKNGASGTDRAGGTGELTLLSESDRLPQGVQRILMAESLLALVHSLGVAAGSSGATPLANSGVLGVLVPLLSDRNVRHSRLVAQAIRAMQAIVEGSAQTLGSQLFRDHDGLGLVAKRIAAELDIDDRETTEEEQHAADESVEVAALSKRGESRELYERLGSRQMTPAEALENMPSSAGTTARGLLPHSKWALLRALHQLLLRALGNGGSEVRELVISSKLPRALRKIMAQPFLHGGSLFQSAATVTTEIAHAEPTATGELVKAGLASTVLRTIRVGLPPCGEAVRCIPNLLAALCLAPNAREDIVKLKPLKLYLLRLATPFYTRALHGESPVIIGSALDELMRHVEALRPDGNEAMIEYLRLSANFVKSDTKAFRRSSRAGSANPSAKSEKFSEGMSVVPTERNALTVGVLSRGDHEKVSPDAVLLDRMKLAIANNASRLAGFAQGSSEHQQGIVDQEGLDHMIQLRYAPALASAEASVREGLSTARHYPTPAHTLNSLGTSLRNFSSRHATAVLKSLFNVILEDAATVLKIGKDLDDLWLPEEDPKGPSSSGGLKSLGGEKQESPVAEPMNILDQSLEERESVPDVSLRAECKAKATSTIGEKNLFKDNLRDEKEGREELRSKMSEALKKLRVGVALLSGLFSRGGPGTSAHVWDSAKGSQVAAAVSAVERAARYHLAIVYTGLTLSASSDGDLSTARVTAAADPEMKDLSVQHVTEALGDLDKAFGWPITSDESFKEACKRYKVPPKGHEAVRQDVTGLPWCLVTFAVAAQRLYSTLSKALTISSRRLSRDPARYAASTKALAATIGRIFALHLVTAEQLWDVKVRSMGDNRVTAAWDYVRGILIEIKGTLFDESQRGTQSVILKSFLDAGGAEALMRATRPFEIVKAASTQFFPDDSDKVTDGTFEKYDKKELDDVLRTNSLATLAYVLALGDIVEHIETNQKSCNELKESLGKGSGVAENGDSVMSSDSVSNQALAISRIVVSEAEPRREQVSAISKGTSSSGTELLGILRNPKKMKALRIHVSKVREAALKRGRNSAIRRVASDVWNTLCNFLHLFGSCPRLLSTNSSPIPESPMANTDWEPWEIQRSALTTTLLLLREVTSHPDSLLAAFKPDGSAMSELLGIIHTSSQVAQELSKKSDKAGNTSIPDESEPYLEIREPISRARIPPDPDMLRSLVEMGFPERRAAHALRQTAPGGLEYAAEWLLTHRDDEDSESLDSDEGAGQRDWDDADEAEEQDEGDGAGNDGDPDEEDGNDDSGENEEDEENEDISGIESALDTEQSLEGREELMVDGPDPEDSRNTEQADSVLSNPPESNSARGGEEAEIRVERKVDQAKNCEDNTNHAPIKVLIDENGKMLLQVSLSTELELLSSALEKSKAVPVGDIDSVRTTAASHVGLALASNDTPSEMRKTKENLMTLPVSVEAFTETKSRLFESLLDVTRAVIQSSANHVHKKHLPYLAIELLSIIQKDGTLREQGMTEFAKLLNEGLQLSLAKPESDEKRNTAGVLGHTTTIWSHYGGNHARRALDACGSFQLAFDCVMKITEDWENMSKSPLVDIEATQPIQKLSIQEDKQEIEPKIQETPNRRSGNTRPPTKITLTTKPILRSVSTNEALGLQKLTTCLLHLDALIRYEAKDSIIQKANEIAESKDDDAGKADKDVPNKQVENMDTDEKPTSDPEDTPTNMTNGNTRNGSQTRNTLNELIRDVFGTSSSAMEIDQKPEDSEVDLEVVRSTAKTDKEELISSTKKTIAAWTTKVGDKTVVSGVSKETLLRKCLSLLEFWKVVEVGDALLAVLQLIGSLTADWGLAQAAIKDGLISLLLTLPQLRAGQSKSTDYKVVRSLTKTILRHLLEDPETLQEAMMAELRSLLSPSPSRTRVLFNMKTLISTTSPLAARDLQCFISALTSTVRGHDSERRGELQLAEFKMVSIVDMELLLEQRSNVKAVISSIAALIYEDHIEESKQSDSPHSQLSTRRSPNDSSCAMSKFALELLSELVEFSQIAAVAFIKTTPPSSDVSGSALDFVIQNMLPARSSHESKSPTSLGRCPDREELSKSARDLFLALCSKTANTHEEAVKSLAKAVKMEADKSKVSVGVLNGLAQCIVPHTKLRVLRVMLESRMANDLARSLEGLDLSVERNFDVAMNVLKALSLIGQAATHLARHGSEAFDDISFGSSSGRDPWGPLRDRDYMVL